MNLAIIGCGAAARRIQLPAAKRAGWTVTAFASRSTESATAARDEWGSGEVVSSWQEAIARDDIDAVCVCTPPALHAEAAVAAAEAGKHVLVEKPIAGSLADADAMIAAAAAHGVVLAVAHNLRTAPPFVAVGECVARGDIGEVVAVRAAFGHGGPEGWAPESVWFRDPAVSGGGALMDLGIHLVDLVLATTGQTISEVGAMLAGDGPVEDAGQLLVRFADGATGTLHASWTARPGPDHQLSIFGTEGTVHLDSATAPTLRRAAGGEPERVRASDPRPDLYAAFAAAVAGEGLPLTDGIAGRRALSVVDAAYRSAASGALTSPA